jgi:hypothetical protein
LMPPRLINPTGQNHSRNAFNRNAGGQQAISLWLNMRARHDSNCIA